MRKIAVVTLCVAAVFFMYKHFIEKPENAGDKVILYSLSFCGYCKKLSTEMANAGIDFVEYYVDKDKSKSDQLQKKLKDHGIQGGGITMPVVDMGDVFLPNRPSISEVERYFK
ncbi:MAG: glutaredoxin family protein [Pseudomonadota bacterium]